MLEQQLGSKLFRTSFYGYQQRFAKEKSNILSEKKTPWITYKNAYMKV